MVPWRLHARHEHQQEAGGKSRQKQANLLFDHRIHGAAFFKMSDATKISSSESDSQRRSSGECDLNSASSPSLLPLARISVSRPFCFTFSAPARLSRAGGSAKRA